MKNLQTNYGDIVPNVFCEYKKKLINRVYKILPMKEEKCETLNKYISSLIRELVGAKLMSEYIEDKETFAIIIFTLEQLKDEEDLLIVKQEVFKTIKLIKQM